MHKTINGDSGFKVFFKGEAKCFERLNEIAAYKKVSLKGQCWSRARGKKRKRTIQIFFAIFLHASMTVAIKGEFSYCAMK